VRREERRIPLSPTLLIAAANAFVGLGENRRGPALEGLVDCLLRQVRAPRDKWSHASWDAALVHHAGYWSHYDHASRQSAWPVPPMVSAAQLGSFARREGVLCEDPVPGDLFLLWGPARHAFVRTGIVQEVESRGRWMSGRDYNECVVIEGGTDRGRTLGGRETLRHLRKLSAARGDRFMRWSALAVLRSRVGRVDAVARHEAREEARRQAAAHQAADVAARKVA